MVCNRSGETEKCSAGNEFPEPSHPLQVEEGVGHERAPNPGASSRRPRHERPRKAKTGKKGTRYRVRLRPIDPAKYPQHTKDRDHPFASMEPAKRVAEIDAFLGLLWARTCREGKHNTNQPPLRAAA